MKRKNRYLITGGTGFLGKKVLAGLQGRVDFDIISRKSGPGRIQGDLSKWQGSLNLDELKKKKYDVFIHLAGLYDLDSPASDVYMNNVVATNSALQIANLLEIPIFVNASSIAASSNQKTENVSAFETNFKFPFPDFYSESKAQAEQLVKNWLSPLRLRINLRLGILVGDSVNGQVDRIDGPYCLVESFKKVQPYLAKWKLPLPIPIPGNEQINLPFVPVDQAAQAILKMCEWGLHEGEIGYRSFHLVPEVGVPLKEYYLSALKHLGLGHLQIKLVNGIPFKLLAVLGKAALDLPPAQLKYALHLPRFNSKENISILGPNWCSEFRDYEEIFWSGYEKYISNR
jgi:UDP-glucose 4-epimerase